MNSATVTHLDTGRQWSVSFPSNRPNALRRAALRTLGADWTDCAGCGVATPRSSVRATLADGRTVVVVAGEADRVVNDHPAFLVSSPVGYADSTVVNVCAACNGSTERTDRTIRANLERAAIDRLERFAT